MTVTVVSSCAAVAAHYVTAHGIVILAAWVPIAAPTATTSCPTTTQSLATGPTILVLLLLPLLARVTQPTAAHTPRACTFHQQRSTRTVQLVGTQSDTHAECTNRAQLRRP